jgi:uncharacterized phiE125 gp8 family phage protein
MEIRIVTDLSSEPVTTESVQQYIKFAYQSDADEVALLEDMISAVRTHLEMRTGLVLAEKSLEVRFDQMDGEELHHSPVTLNPSNLGFRLPVYPVSSVSEVKTVSLDDSEETLTKNSDYYEKGKYERVIIYPLGVTQELVVSLTVGFSTSTQSLPADIKEAIKKQVGRWYYYRDDYREGNFIDEVSNIIAQYQ